MYDINTGIALNVSRARLTVIGFILTIDIFALGIFLRDMESEFASSILAELSVFYALVASICLGTVAATLMLISERFDPLGNSDVGIFAIAEMTMFVAIVQTISGISEGFIILFQVNLGDPAVAALGFSPDASGFLEARESFRTMVFWLISSSWFFVAYVAPIWSLSRLPVKPGRKIIFTGFYFMLTGLVFLMSAFALNIEMLARGESSGVGRLFVQTFWSPGLWGDLFGTL